MAVPLNIQLYSPFRKDICSILSRCHPTLRHVGNIGLPFLHRPLATKEGSPPREGTVGSYGSGGAVGHKKKRGDFIGLLAECKVCFAEGWREENLLGQLWFIAEDKKSGSLRKSGNGFGVEGEKVHLVVGKNPVISEADMEKGGRVCSGPESPLCQKSRLVRNRIPGRREGLWNILSRDPGSSEENRGSGGDGGKWIILKTRGSILVHGDLCLRLPETRDGWEEPEDGIVAAMGRREGIGDRKDKRVAPK
jgi:hypothetical protein